MNNRLILGLGFAIILGGLIVVAVQMHKQQPAVVNTIVSPSPTNAVAVSSLKEIAINNFAFVPADVTLKKGSVVTWTNQDTQAHSVVADQLSVDVPGSLSFEQGQSYTFTFSKLGIYPYHCGIHNQMTGTVTVTD